MVVFRFDYYSSTRPRSVAYLHHRQGTWPLPDLCKGKGARRPEDSPAEQGPEDVDTPVLERNVAMLVAGSDDDHLCTDRRS